MEGGAAFPEGFVWGVATSAYQIEGAAEEDGRGPSVWDTFCTQPGAIADATDGRIACEHRHRAEADVQLIHDLGVKAYRLSISWPRVLPDGVGARSEPGLAFYDRLIDSLLARGMRPWVTLYHWDMPQTLADRGGWLVRESADWFAEYTAHVVDRLSDRVEHWITLNEPEVFFGLGHVQGTHAPGLKLSRSQALAAIHNALLAHGAATDVIRARAVLRPLVGLSSAAMIRTPTAPTDDAIARARRETFSFIDGPAWPFSSAWYLDAAYRGAYPSSALDALGPDAPIHEPHELDRIARPLDFLGVNIYQSQPAGGLRPIQGEPRTTFGWRVTPEAMRWGPQFLHERYRVPLFISENGLASMDWVHADGRVHDHGRIDFITRYLTELRRGIAEGADVRGYFHWSLMDNFEWAEGYAKRFGLVYVDYQTQERIPKDSFAWYREIVRTNGRCLAHPTAPLR